MLTRFAIPCACLAFGLSFSTLAFADDQSSTSTPSSDAQNIDTTSQAGASATTNEGASYLSRGGFDTGSDTSGSTNSGSDLQPAPTTATPNQ